MQIIVFFFFNDTATTEIYTLSLHDALPIYADSMQVDTRRWVFLTGRKDSLYNMARHVYKIDDPANNVTDAKSDFLDRKSTRLNSSHANISYAVFCLKKKNTQN